MHTKQVWFLHSFHQSVFPSQCSSRQSMRKLKKNPKDIRVTTILMCLFRCPGWPLSSHSSCWLVHLLPAQDFRTWTWMKLQEGSWRSHRSCFSWQILFFLFWELPGAFPSCSGEFLCFRQKWPLRNLLCVCNNVPPWVALQLLLPHTPQFSLSLP